MFGAEVTEGNQSIPVAMCIALNVSLGTISIELCFLLATLVPRTRSTPDSVLMSLFDGPRGLLGTPTGSKVPWCVETDLPHP